MIRGASDVLKPSLWNWTLMVMVSAINGVKPRIIVYCLQLGEWTSGGEVPMPPANCLKYMAGTYWYNARLRLKRLRPVAKDSICGSAQSHETNWSHTSHLWSRLGYRTYLNHSYWVALVANIMWNNTLFCVSLPDQSLNPRQRICMRPKATFWKTFKSTKGISSPLFYDN